ncbi:hypothetical protein EVG20_g9825 [Dentipellis fragilis]|uniref:Uncharacterized protein n=1 Tax=Dentipellis fragilis TaxID=205917 RepID=A0A4Y9XVI9_9AGAM|nr:hypothetical protein EVG20_g9825 [Dentipellis fragilis]
MPAPANCPLDIEEEAWLQEVLPRFRGSPSADKPNIMKDIQIEFRKEFPYPDDQDTYWRKEVKDYLYENGRERTAKDMKRWMHSSSYRDVIAFYKKDEVKREQGENGIEDYQPAVNRVIEKLTPAERKAFGETLKQWEEEGVPVQVQQA